MPRKTTHDLIAEALVELEQIVLELELDNDELNSALSEFEFNITQLESSEELTGFKILPDFNRTTPPNYKPLEFFPDE